ncbi:uncharacterized protein LOC141723451 [Apium graveolens]|uniref:uncharacterized protein LOC141723451 n=1 Tax=Apium graveolens TaxID=4045 RepID=UPI003D7BDACA
MTNYIIFLFLFCVVNGPGTSAGEKIDPLTDWFNRDETIKFAGYGEDKLSTVLVTGTLLCHPLYQRPFPISGASVAVSCQAGRKTRQSNRIQSTTDENGDFLFDIPSNLHGIPNLEKICCVSVLQLPKSSPCKPAFTRKHKGISLSDIGEGLRTYTTGTIQLRPKTAGISRHAGGRKPDIVKAN